MRKKISSDSDLEARFAYSRAIVDGDWVFVSGTTGLNYATGEISDDVTEQAEQTFRNIDEALTEAGASLNDAVRVQYTLIDADEMTAIAPVLNKWLGNARPAATAVIARLLDPRMKVEVEVTIRKAGNS